MKEKEEKKIDAEVAAPKRLDSPVVEKHLIRSKEAQAAWTRAKKSKSAVIQAEIHLGARPWVGNEKRQELLDLVQKEIQIESYLEGYVNASEVLERFLCARDNIVIKAKKLLVQALNWRKERRPDLIDYAEMEKEARTGKVRVAYELDVWGRSIVIFDNTVQNTHDPQAHMRFLAFNLNHALRRMSSPISKYVVFMHLTNFSLSNNPSWNVTKETLLMLVCAFAECCGHIILFGAPRVFRFVFNACKPFIDPNTFNKIIFIPDSYEADQIIIPILGPDWRQLTGASQNRETPNSSPGYCHSRHWSKTLIEDRDWRRRTKNIGALAHTPINWPGPDPFHLDPTKLANNEHFILPPDDLLDLCDPCSDNSTNNPSPVLPNNKSKKNTALVVSCDSCFSTGSKTLHNEHGEKSIISAIKEERISHDLRLLFVLAGGLVCCAIVAVTTSLF